MKLLLTRHGIGLLALVAAIPAAAQSNASKGMDQAAIQRSWDIQAQLANIDSNRETFINNFIASWTGNVDTALFNVSSELRPLLESATSWRLYAASLVGDYNGMMQVLRGEVPAGKVINALNAPQPHGKASAALSVNSVLPLSTLTSVSPLALGSATSQLVFTPIPPCRIADTRFSPFGPLLPFVPRAFDLTTDAFGKNQGGQLSCPGLPSFSFYSWSVNITATGYSTSGYVQVYPFAGAFPSTSILNFGPALPAIANSSTVTGCYGCIEDINVVASATTHIILDVYGYFELPTGFTTGVITKLAGPTTSLAPGAYLPIFGASCPAGTRVIGGAQTTSGTSANTPLTSDHNIDPSEPRWYEWVKNTGTTAAVSVTIYSICQDVS